MKVSYLIGAALFGVIVLGAVAAQQDKARLSNLKATDFEAYLSQIQSMDELLYLRELEGHDRARWIDALKEHDHSAWLQIAVTERPGEYAEYQATIARRVAELDAEVKAVPASDIKRNLDLYEQLADLVPDNQRYQEKAAHYGDLVRERDWKSQNCTVAKKREGAILYANDVIRASLKAPRSARFPWQDKPKVVSVGECKFLVSSYVDAQNGFGAEIRSQFEVSLEATPAGWRVNDLVIY